MVRNPTTGCSTNSQRQICSHCSPRERGPVVLAVSGCFAKLLSSPRASPLKCSFSMSDWVCVTHDRDALGYVLPAGFVVPPGKSARAGSFLLQTAIAVVRQCAHLILVPMLASVQWVACDRALLDGLCLYLCGAHNQLDAEAGVIISD